MCGGLGLGVLAEKIVQAHAPLLIFVPGDLVFTHPKGLDDDFVLGALVFTAILFRVGAAHEEFAAADGQHVEFHIGTGDLLGVGLHIGLGLGFGVFHGDRFKHPFNGGGLTQVLVAVVGGPTDSCWNQHKQKSKTKKHLPSVPLGMYASH